MSTEYITFRLKLELIYAMCLVYKIQCQLAIDSECFVHFVVVYYLLFLCGNKIDVFSVHSILVLESNIMNFRCSPSNIINEEIKMPHKNEFHIHKHPRIWITKLNGNFQHSEPLSNEVMHFLIDLIKIHTQTQRLTIVHPNLMI